MNSRPSSSLSLQSARISRMSQHAGCSKHSHCRRERLGISTEAVPLGTCLLPSRLSLLPNYEMSHSAGCPENHFFHPSLRCFHCNQVISTARSPSTTLKKATDIARVFSFKSVPLLNNSTAGWKRVLGTQMEVEVCLCWSTRPALTIGRDL